MLIESRRETMKSTTTALALVLIAAAGPAFAQYMSAPPPMNPPQTAVPPPQQQAEQAPQKAGITPSPKARKALVDLQTAVNANDAANIPAKLAAAQAVASTKEDHYLIGELRLKAALASKDNNAMVAAVDAIANSGYEQPAQMAKLYAGLAGNFFNAKQYAQAAAAYQKAARLDPANTDVLQNLAETQFAQGGTADAVATFQHEIQIEKGAGQKAPEAVYKRALSIAYDAKLPSSVELGREWLAAYPSPDSWHNAIAVYRNQAHPDEEATLDLLRLMQAAGALTSPGDYSLFLEAAADQANYNEAQAVVDAGIAANVINPTDARFRGDIAALKSKQKATAADLETATKTATSGMALLRIGDRYYGMGDYAKAADLDRQAKARGVDPSLADLHLGMALARAGDKAGATAAFNGVTGPLADVAKFWLVYVQQHA
jgi:tetratricopeptide (TPR) repeat protein